MHLDALLQSAMVLMQAEAGAVITALSVFASPFVSQPESLLRGARLDGMATPWATPRGCRNPSPRRARHCQSCASGSSSRT